MPLRGSSLKEVFHKERLVSYRHKASHRTAVPGQEVASLLIALTGGRQKCAQTSGREEDR